MKKYELSVEVLEARTAPGFSFPGDNFRGPWG